jgi:hypothetical protein
LSAGIDQKRRRDNKERRAIRRGARDRLGADRTAGARPVFDDHGRPAGAPSLVRHQPRDDVGGAAGCVRNHDANGPRNLRPRRVIGGKSDIGARSREQR